MRQALGAACRGASTLSGDRNFNPRFCISPTASPARYPVNYASVASNPVRMPPDPVHTTPQNPLIVPVPQPMDGPPPRPVKTSRFIKPAPTPPSAAPTPVPAGVLPAQGVGVFARSPQATRALRSVLACSG